MKALTGTTIFLFTCIISIAQNVGIGTTTPNASAALEIMANNKGLLIPRTSSASRTGIVSPAKGLFLYDTTTGSFWFHNGGTWVQLGANGNGWSITGNAGTEPATNFIGTTDAQPLIIKVNNIKAGHIDHELAKGNTSWGFESFMASTTGFFNTATGYRSLWANTTGARNTAIGLYALRLNTTGDNNTASGTYALASNTTGSHNVASGVSSLLNNVTGSHNTAYGTGSLSTNTSGNQNTGIGYGALYHNETGSYNTASGYTALYVNTTGNHNTATGFASLDNNTTGGWNTSNGSFAMSHNITGIENTATGASALEKNTTGSQNTADGRYALYYNITGKSNTATGYQAMFNNTYGIENTAVGNQAMVHSTGGENNTALGFKAMYGTSVSGDYTYFKNSTAIGSYSMYYAAASSGGYAAWHCTALGAYSMYNNTYGLFNTAIGYNALSTNINGSGNTSIGNYADVSVGNLSNATAIGSNCVVNANNKVVIGSNASGMVIGGYAAWSNLSDGRFKENIKDDVPGLQFITKLRPVTYTVNTQKLDEHIMQQMGDSVRQNRMQKPEAYAFAKTKIQSGFIAQEVEKTAKEMGYDFDGINAPKNLTDNYSIAYSQFIMPLVKAVQEQQVIIEGQNKKIEFLCNKLQLVTEKPIKN